MADYKVPQDVEAEDKLLGPFSFRQFIYLVVACACFAASWGMFRLFPLLIIFPLPIAVFFLVLALPLKKDQPMEVYLAAVINYHLKPKTRLWKSGQKESTVTITAPKKVEESRTRDITGEEASHRLSFLANIVDTEGFSIKNNSSIREEYIAEANSIPDILDTSTASHIGQMISNNQNLQHQNTLNEMKSALINQQTPLSTPTPAPSPQPPQSAQPAQPNNNFTNLANNPAYSVQTIQNQANRIQNQNNGSF